MKLLLLPLLKARISDQLTNGVAVLGMTSPWWVSTLNTASSWASTVLPILSALWIVTQITRAAIETHYQRKLAEKELSKS